MLASSAQLRCCHAYLHSYLHSAATTTAHRRSTDSPASDRRIAVHSQRVLVVEFRDEVYASLKSLLEAYGWEVARAASGAEVATQVNRFAPDLLLVNESMPDKSGWLITCKLRLTKHRQPVWLFAAHTPPIRADWKESCGVDEVIAYGGVLSRLVLRVRERLERRRDGSGVNRGRTSHPGVAVA